MMAGPRFWPERSSALSLHWFRQNLSNAVTSKLAEIDGDVNLDELWTELKLSIVGVSLE